MKKDIRYYNFIEFLLDMKSDLDQGHDFEDYMLVTHDLRNFVSYRNEHTDKIISIYHDNMVFIPTLPGFPNYWCSSVVRWLKENGTELERLSKLKSFL